MHRPVLFPPGQLPLPPPAQTGPSALYTPLLQQSSPVGPPPPGPPPPWRPDMPWHGGDIPSAASTAKGWQPNKARTTMMLIQTPAEAQRSRRRMYIALAGFAVGIGVGVGVIIAAAGTSSVTSEGVAAGSAGAAGSAARSGSGTGSGTSADGSGGSESVMEDGSAGSAGSAATPVNATPDVPVRTLLTAQRDL